MFDLALQRLLPIIQYNIEKEQEVHNNLMLTGCVVLQTELYAIIKKNLSMFEKEHSQDANLLQTHPLVYLKMTYKGFFSHFIL